MRILFLDDSEERHRRFCRSNIGAIVYQAYTAAQAIGMLRAASPFDIASLDHDLSDEAAAGNPSEEEATGLTVAEYIANHMEPEAYPKLVVIHSFNPEGALRMKRALEPAGIPINVTPFQAGQRWWRDAPWCQHAEPITESVNGREHCVGCGLPVPR